MLFLIELGLTIWAAVRHQRMYFLTFLLVPFALSFVIGFFIGLATRDPYVVAGGVTLMALIINFTYICFMAWLVASPKDKVNEMFN